MLQILLYPCVIFASVMLHASGFLMWAVYRWAYRGQPREKIVDGVFAFQVVLSGAILYFKHFWPELLGSYYASLWWAFWVALNAICTIVGMIAWLCEDFDSAGAGRYPRA